MAFILNQIDPYSHIRLGMSLRYEVERTFKELKNIQDLRRIYTGGASPVEQVQLRIIKNKEKQMKKEWWKACEGLRQFKLRGTN